MKKFAYLVAGILFVFAALVPFSRADRWETYDSLVLDCNPPASDCYHVIAK